MTDYRVVQLLGSGRYEVQFRHGGLFKIFGWTSFTVSFNSKKEAVHVATILKEDEKFKVVWP